MVKKISLALAALILGGTGASAQVIATDNFENDNPSAAYDNGIQYGDNGGSGFGALTYLEGTGGGLFDASLDGARALGIYAGINSGNTQALGRTSQSSFLSGVYSLAGRFDLNNSVGTSGFNIKSGLGSTFGANQELFFGLTPSSGNGVIFITDSTGDHTLALPGVTELRGLNLTFAVAFDTLADSYTLKVSEFSNSSINNSFTGSLTDTNGASAGSGAISAIGFINFNTGNGQNLVADDLDLVPEPSTWMAAGLVSAFILASILRRRSVKG